MLIKLKNKDTLIFDEFIFQCAIGKNGTNTTLKIINQSYNISLPKNHFKFNMYERCKDSIEVGRIN